MEGRAQERPVLQIASVSEFIFIFIVQSSYMDKIITRTAEISLYEKNIVWEDFKQGIQIDADDIRENIAASLKLTEGRKHSAVLDARGRGLTITNKAMSLGASAEVTKDRFATAHLTNSVARNIIGNFFIKFFKPRIQNRMFSDEKEAIGWLRSVSK